jgi:serine/threonine protein kinase/tetratricopeptide (TPR) repeat protein
VVKTYGIARDEHRTKLFIVMEPAARSLERAMMDRSSRQQGAQLPVADVIRWMYDVARALQHVHEQGVCHLDLKAANVLLFNTGHAKLADFGLSQAMENREATTAAEKGTFETMAPEQWTPGTALGGFTDVYAFGVVLFHLVTGCPPFRWITHSNDGQHRDLPRAELRAAIRAAVVDEHLLAFDYPQAKTQRLSPCGLTTLAWYCIKADPRSRPTMAAVVARMASIDADDLLPPQNEYRPPTVEDAPTVPSATASSSGWFQSVSDHAWATHSAGMSFAHREHTFLKTLARQPSLRSQYDEYPTFALAWALARKRQALNGDRFMYRGMPFTLPPLGDNTPNDSKELIVKECCIELALRPNFADIWFILGDYGGGGTVGGAAYGEVACYERALAIDTGHANAWNNMGFEGGGNVGGAAYGKIDCYQRALECDPRHVYAWINTGDEGGCTLDGSAHDNVACYERALNIYPRSANAWTGLWHAGGGSVDGVAHDEAACVERLLAIAPEAAVAWTFLGWVGGGSVAGAAHGAPACFDTALRLARKQHLPADDVAEFLQARDEARAEWCNRGFEGGGTVKGVAYSRVACWEHGLAIDPRHASTWSNLGADGGGMLGGVPYSKVECYERALEIDPRHVRAWSNLGAEGGGMVGGVKYRKRACYERALGIDPRDATPWFNLGNVGGGTVDGVPHRAVACYERALAIDRHHVDAWRYMGDEGGGTVDGVDYDKVACVERAVGIDPSDVTSWSIRNVADPLAAARACRGEGAALFAQGLHADAQPHFVRALSLLGDVDGGRRRGAAATAEERELSLSCHLNIASCCVKLREPKDAIKHCTKALDISPDHAKALFRRGQAQNQLKEFDQAVAGLKRALALTNGDTDVQAALTDAESAIAAQKASEKKAFSKMFS